jgi:hypothetical protein
MDPGQKEFLHFLVWAMMALAVVIERFVRRI